MVSTQYLSFLKRHVFYGSKENKCNKCKTHAHTHVRTNAIFLRRRHAFDETQKLCVYVLPYARERKLYFLMRGNKKGKISHIKKIT